MGAVKAISASRLALCETGEPKSRLLRANQVRGNELSRLRQSYLGRRLTPDASQVTVRATYGDALVNLVPGDPTPIQGRGLSASLFPSARLGIQLPQLLFDEFSNCVSRRLACLELGGDLLRSTARTLRDLLSQPALPAAQFDHLSLAFFRIPSPPFGTSFVQLDHEHVSRRFAHIGFWRAHIPRCLPKCQ